MLKSERENEREREREGGDGWEPGGRASKRDGALRAAKVHWPKEKRNTV